MPSKWSWYLAVSFLAATAAGSFAQSTSTLKPDDHSTKSTPVMQGSFLQGFIAAFSFIVVSEIGDKTFFIAAIMAMKHPRLIVFGGAISALVFMTILSAAFGSIATVIPRVYTYYASAILFAIFGIKMLRDGWKMDPNEGQEELEEVQMELKRREDQNGHSKESATGTKTPSSAASTASDTPEKENQGVTSRKENQEMAKQEALRAPIASPESTSTPVEPGPSVAGIPSTGPSTAATSTTASSIAGPTTAEPSTAALSTAGPSTAASSTAGSTTTGSSTAAPLSAGPQTVAPSTAGRTTTGPSNQTNTLREDKDEAMDMLEQGQAEQRRRRRKAICKVFLQAASLTFVAEWGDRSQLTTVVLATREDVFGVIVGGSLGHALCTGLAVIGGRMLAQKISVRTVTIIGGLVFLFFAVSALFISPDAF